MFVEVAQLRSRSKGELKCLSAKTLQTIFELLDDVVGASGRSFE